jgi:hypothetical protein
MVQPAEDKKGYASPLQRDILCELLTQQTIREVFFLTGGTALSVFYLHHRLSDDLDFFTTETVDLGQIGSWAKNRWPQKTTAVRQGGDHLSLLVAGIKVDFVLDRLSDKGDRPRVILDGAGDLAVDTIENIASNKFCTLASRTEPKDFVDFYLLLKKIPELTLENLYLAAKAKDAIFDDYPTVAYQVETGFKFTQQNPQLMPKMLMELDIDDFSGFYGKLAKWLYQTKPTK